MHRQDSRFFINFRIDWNRVFCVVHETEWCSRSCDWDYSLAAPTRDKQCSGILHVSEMELSIDLCRSMWVNLHPFNRADGERALVVRHNAHCVHMFSSIPIFIYLWLEEHSQSSLIVSSIPGKILDCVCSILDLYEILRTFNDNRNFYD